MPKQKGKDLDLNWFLLGSGTTFEILMKAVDPYLKRTIGVFTCKH